MRRVIKWDKFTLVQDDSDTMWVKGCWVIFASDDESNDPDPYHGNWSGTIAKNGYMYWRDREYHNTYKNETRILEAWLKWDSGMDLDEYLAGIGDP